MNVKSEQARFLLSDTLIAWDLFLTHLANVKEGDLEHDLFSQIEFLSELEKARAIVSTNLTQLERCFKQMSTLEKNILSPEELEQVNELKEESAKTLEPINQQLGICEESYEEVLEEILDKCQARVSELSEKILEHHEKAISPDAEAGVNLEEEDQLSELRDSLEMYKEMRLESSKDEKSDPIIDRVESQIVACDVALLIDESSS